MNYKTIDQVKTGSGRSSPTRRKTSYLRVIQLDDNQRMKAHLGLKKVDDSKRQNLLKQRLDQMQLPLLSKVKMSQILETVHLKQQQDQRAKERKEKRLLMKNQGQYGFEIQPSQPVTAKNQSNPFKIELAGVQQPLSARGSSDRSKHSGAEPSARQEEVIEKINKVNHYETKEVVKRADSLDAAEDVVELLFDNMGLLMDEQKAVGQGKETARKAVQQLLVGTTSISNYNADQKITSHVIHGNHTIQHDQDEEPEEILRPDHDKFQTTFQKNHLFKKPMSQSRSRSKNNRNDSNSSRRKQKGINKSFNFSRGLGPLAIKKKFNRVNQEDETHQTQNPTINISLLPKQHDKDAPPALPTLQSPISPNVSDYMSITSPNSPFSPTDSPPKSPYKQSRIMSPTPKGSRKLVVGLNSRKPGTPRSNEKMVNLDQQRSFKDIIVDASVSSGTQRRSDLKESSDALSSQLKLPKNYNKMQESQQSRKTTYKSKKLKLSKVSNFLQKEQPVKMPMQIPLKEIYPNLEDYLINGSVNQELRQQKLTSEVKEEIKYNRRRIAVKEHYKLLDENAQDQLNFDLNVTEFSTDGDDKVNLTEFIFDQNTGKATHYTRQCRDFTEGQDAENTRRGNFTKQLVPTLKQKVDEEMLTKRVKPHDLPVVLRRNRGSDDELDQFGDSCFIDDEMDKVNLTDIIDSSRAGHKLLTGGSESPNSQNHMKALLGAHFKSVLSQIKQKSDTSATGQNSGQASSPNSKNTTRPSSNRFRTIADHETKNLQKWFEDETRFRKGGYEAAAKKNLQNSVNEAMFQNQTQKIEPYSNKVTLSYNQNANVFYQIKKKGKNDDRDYRKMTIKEYEMMRKKRFYAKDETSKNQEELDPNSNEFFIENFTTDSIHSVVNGMNIASSFKNSKVNINLNKVGQRFDRSSPRQGSPMSPNIGIDTIRYSNNVSNRNEDGTFRQYTAEDRQFTDNDRHDTNISDLQQSYIDAKEELRLKSIALDQLIDKNKLQVMNRRIKRNQIQRGAVANSIDLNMLSSSTNTIPRNSHHISKRIMSPQLDSVINYRDNTGSNGNDRMQSITQQFNQNVLFHEGPQTQKFKEFKKKINTVLEISNNSSLGTQNQSRGVNYQMKREIEKYQTKFDQVRLRNSTQIHRDIVDKSTSARFGFLEGMSSMMVSTNDNTSESMMKKTYRDNFEFPATGRLALLNQSMDVRRNLMSPQNMNSINTNRFAQDLSSYQTTARQTLKTQNNGRRIRNKAWQLKLDM